MISPHPSPTRFSLNIISKPLLPTSSVNNIQRKYFRLSTINYFYLHWDPENIFVKSYVQSKGSFDLKVLLVRSHWRQNSATSFWCGQRYKNNIHLHDLPRILHIMSIAKGKDFGPLKFEPVQPKDVTNPDLIAAFRGFHAAMEAKSFPDILEYYSQLNMTFRMNCAPMNTPEALKVSLDTHWSMVTGPSVLTHVTHIPEDMVRQTLTTNQANDLFKGQKWFDKAIEEINAMKREGGEMEGDLGEGGVLSVKAIHVENTMDIMEHVGVGKGDYYYARSEEDGVWRMVWQDCLESGYPDKAIQMMQEMTEKK